MADHIGDASCLINLYASGKIGRIISVSGEKFYVSEQVRAEVLTIRQPDAQDPSKIVSAPVDLSDAVGREVFQECRLEGQTEIDAFVRFAGVLDDGEASCLALALSRGLIVATDDKKAIRIATEEGILVITTPELIQAWARAEGVSDVDVADVLHRIERFAKFRPHRSSAFHDWWTGLVDQAAH